MTNFNNQEIKLITNASRIKNLLKSAKMAHKSRKYLREVTYSDINQFAIWRIEYLETLCQLNYLWIHYVTKSDVSL